MSRAASPTAIGAFVVGAVALAVAAVVFFGSAKLGGQRQKFVCFFHESVEGLQIGAKVTFKGVPIGEVTRILIRFEDGDAESDGGRTGIRTQITPRPIIPVIFEIDRGRIESRLGVELSQGDPDIHLRNVESGLRAKLKTSSLITGLLILDLDFYRDPSDPLPADFSPIFEHNETAHFVIPAEKSDLVALKEQFYLAIDRLSEVQFDQLGANFNALLQTMDVKISAVDVDNLNDTIAEIRAAVEGIEVSGPLASIEEAGAKIAAAAEALQAQLETAELGTVSSDLQATLQSTGRAMDTVADSLSSQSETRAELDRALSKAADAATEIEALAAFLAEQPNSIIWGRKDKDKGSNADDSGTERPRVLSSRERFSSPVRSRR